MLVLCLLDNWIKQQTSEHTLNIIVVGVIIKIITHRPNSISRTRTAAQQQWLKLLFSISI